MSEFAGFDLDRSTARAWSRFQARLADHLAEMQDDDVLVVAAEASDEDTVGSAPYVQFCAWGETMVRAEVSSNVHLADEHRLDDQASGMVTALGWSAPATDPDDEVPGRGSSNFYLDLERVQADRLAVMTTRALRDVFGVAHPAFLTTDNLADDESPDLGVPRLGGPASAGALEPSEEAIAVAPRDRDHLLALVDDALTPYFGHVPEHDADDDIPVVSGSALIFVQVDPQMPAIQLFSVLVHDVVDHDRAAFEVAVLNRDLRFLKFVLVDGSVMAYVNLPAMPFAPEHLRMMLAMMSEVVDKIDDDLAVRVGGSRTFEPDDLDAFEDDDDDEDDDEDDDLDAFEDDDEPAAEPADTTHPAMLTLLELDADAPGSLTPELAASVCGMDRDLVLELITWNSEQEIAWRTARDDAALRDAPEEADVCDHESRHAEAMVNLLRRALRLLVEQQLGRDLQQSAYGTALRRRSRPPWPRPADALPGVDVADDQPGLDGLWEQP